MDEAGEAGGDEEEEEEEAAGARGGGGGGAPAGEVVLTPKQRKLFELRLKLNESRKARWCKLNPS